MKIAFVQEELFPYMSFMHLAAIAKKRGYGVDVFVANISDEFIASIVNYKPNIICFSTTTPNYNFTRETAKKLKQMLPDSFVLVGGWHPTFNPDILGKETCFDALCLGEGETPFEVFLESYPDSNALKKVPNFHIRLNNEIYRNPMINLVQNLDEIPFPDRSIYYDKFELLKNQSTKIFCAGRGCPYPCTYCFNENMQKIYKQKGKYVRLRSPENIAEEINLVASKYPVKYVQFYDDTFNSDKKWLLSFLDCYRKEVHYPFLAVCRVDRLDEELVIKMKEAGVDRIDFAIEHGNDEYRTKMLGRSMKNSEIIKGSRLLKKYNIRFHVTSMIGLPGETLDLAYETLKINQQIKPDFAHMTLFQPYPGTKLYNIAKSEGYIREDFDADNISGHTTWATNKTKLHSVMKNDDIRKMINIRSFFPLLVKHPNLLPIIKPLLNLPPNKYFEFVYAFNYTQIKFKFASNRKESLNYLLQLTKKILPAFLQNFIEKRLGFQTLV